MAGLYLASQSPRRTELLTQVGIDHTVVSSSYEEPNEGYDSPIAMVKAQALGKARCAVGIPKGGIVLGADTIVVLDNEVLGKPQDEADARKMLERLSGRSHSVVTGVALLIKGDEVVFHNETKVYFKELAPFEIESYIASGEPMDKAGAYGIQGKGALWVEKIEGSYTNVVGLPVEHVYDELCKALGAK
ncbi:Maf family protein [uncultured Veillonella sp.]|uniref:Maf family protein n=1 Tax=uncultured Veillonella sp. TaxID=159268 RepID=UPI0028ED72C6|nr:Maf family protein [uncultured Veillonella sp.]